jgi:hypothetical protein
MSLDLAIVDREVHHLRGLERDCLPYAVFDADFGERRSTGRSSFVRHPKRAASIAAPTFTPIQASRAKAGINSVRTIAEKLTSAWLPYQ